MGWDDKNEIKTLETLIRKEKDATVRDRLRGIFLLMNGYTRGDVTQLLGVTTRTVQRWKKKYATSGYEGLQTKLITGRNTVLSEEDMKKLKELLQKKEYWTTKEIRVLIKTEFDREFTLRHIPRILRKLGMTYSKPYVNDYQRPEDAEEILKKDYRARLWMTP